MELCIDCTTSPVPGEIEIVERKGLGHPDTICDALAERLSATLSNFYLERFGQILHHNVDKALLVGGSSAPLFGAGEVTEPIEIHLAGRAVTRVSDVTVPLEELAVEASKSWLRENLRQLDVERHVKFQLHVRPGSIELRDLFQRGSKANVYANDTSYGVGFAPLSELEALTLAIEQELNSPLFRLQHPEGGEDVKVMAARHGQRVEITVARAFVGRHLPDLTAYLAAKEALRIRVQERARRLFPRAEVAVNASDRPESGAVYLTVTGTSAEAGDDGEVGRGNRVNGLITPYRPMSLEAAAGKNSISHAGKLYNLLAREIAERLCKELGIRQAEVMLLSKIGHPIAEPSLVHVRLALAEPEQLASLAPRAHQLLRGQLAQVGELWQRVIRGELKVY